MTLHSRGQKLRPSSRTKLRPAPKVADAVYADPRYKAFRDVVLKRAGYWCEWADPDTGVRCPKREPHDRMVADHILELKDGGAPFDPANGQCHCVQHNTSKGIAARAARSHQGEGGANPQR